MSVRGGVWLLLSIAWIALVAYFSLESWPRMSLDLGGDAATRALYDRAVFMHVAMYALAALVPPLVLVLLGRVFGRTS